MKYIVIDDVLDSPDALIDLGLRTRYYSSDSIDIYDIPIHWMEERRPPGAWPGYRSDLLWTIDKDIYRSTFTQLFGKIPELAVKNIYQAYMHLLPERFKFKPSWMHTDPTVYSGVLYLSKDVVPGAGTILEVDGERIEIENKFNRLLVFNSTLVHAPQGSFGNDLSNSRMTLNFFVN